MHFPTRFADQRLTQIRHSGNPEVTHGGTSLIQISCIVLVVLGMSAKIAFAVDSLDWWDCKYYSIDFISSTIEPD